MNADPDSIHREQIEYWNNPAGEAWTAAQEHIDRLLAPLSQRLVEAAAVHAGERVLDIGCGCGATSLALADADVGAVVTGVDVSAPMLARARERAAGRDELHFVNADVGSHRFHDEFDLAFSRFGVMFFGDPVAAFGNIHRHLRDHGRLCFACWQAPRLNPWAAEPGAAIKPFLPDDETPPDPRAPGPFAFAETDYVRGILEAAGFGDIAFADCAIDMRVGEDLAEALGFYEQIGPISRALLEMAPDTRERALEVIAHALDPYVSADGVVLPGAYWIVTARA